jgi:hypothetical protein
MNGRRRKAWSRYWLARGWLVLAVLGLFGPAIIGAERYPSYWIVWSVLFVVPGAWMVVSLTAFPLKYSAFGPFRRTPLPKAPSSWFNELAAGIGLYRTNRAQRWLANHLGMTRFPWTSWRVYADGLGVTITFFGSAFVHREQLVSLREKRRGRWILEHASPELADPITLYDDRLVKAVQAIMPPG